MFSEAESVFPGCEDGVPWERNAGWKWLSLGKLSVEGSAEEVATEAEGLVGGVTEGSRDNEPG
jgi:hypothetical protein